MLFIDGRDDVCGAHIGLELMTWTCLVCGSVLLSQVPLSWVSASFFLSCSELSLWDQRCD